MENLHEFSVAPVKWEHDSQIGLFVDLEKGLLQFFLNRKKHGPAIHLREHLGKEVFYAVSISTPKTVVNAHWHAVCPKVFLG
jgi:hypothetical protein